MISMIDALGTSMPTSITVVLTRMSISAALNRCIVASLSAADMRPCIIATCRCGKRLRIASNPCFSGFKFSFSDSSMIG